MFSLSRFATLAYVLTVFLGGYLAVSTLKGLWETADHYDRLAAAGAYGAQTLDNTLLVFDAIDPAAGGAGN